MSSSHTYVLIHGGGCTGRFWDRMVGHLDAPAFAVDLPGRAGKPGDLGTLTVDEEVASVVADVQAASIDGPIVVVAHSSGGLVTPGAVAGLGDRVTNVVLNAALVPPEGGLGLDCMKPHHREGLELAMQMAAGGEPVILPGPPEDSESFRDVYGGDPLTDDEIAFMVDPSRCVRDTVNHYFQPVRWSIAADVPVTYVINERDRPVTPENQEAMISRLPNPTTVARLDAGHIPAVTDPAGLAALVVEASSTVKS